MHPNAAGCSILNTNLGVFHSYANEALKDYDFGENYFKINFQRSCFDNDVVEIINEVGQYKSIWSQRNEEPRIHITDVHISSSDIQIMGKNKDTVKFIINDVTYIKFFAKDLIEEIKEKGTVSMEIIGTANLNHFNEMITPQIFIEAYELKKENVKDLISF